MLWRTRAEHTPGPQWCGVDKHRSQTTKRAEWATSTGNSLGRHSWSANNKCKTIGSSHAPMSSAPVDRSKTRAQAPAGSSGTTCKPAQQAPSDVPQTTMTHQSRDSKRAWLEVFLPTKESKTPMDTTATEAKKSPAEQVPELDSKLVLALARLALQHESERRAHARDDNVVFSMPSSGELAKELQWAADKYAETGAQLKKEHGRELQGPSQRQETRRDVCLPAVPHAPGHPDESRRGQHYSSGALCGEQHTHGKEPEGSCTSDPTSGGGTSKPTRKQFVPRGALSSSPRKTKQRSGLQRPTGTQS